MNRSQHLLMFLLLSIAFLSILNMPDPTQAAVAQAWNARGKASKFPDAISLAQTANSTQTSTVTSGSTSTIQTLTTPTSSLSMQSVTVTSLATATSVSTLTSVATTTSVSTTTSTSVSTATSSTSSTLATSTTTTQTTQTTAVVTPTLTLSPTSAGTAATVDATGSGFSTSDTSCSLSGGALASQSCTISDGTLAGAFTVATDAAGVYTITATGDPVGDMASASFVVSSLPPSITLSPSSASEGATVEVSGSNFLASDSSCSISGTPVNDYTCSISGGILTGTFSVAPVDTGTYTLTIVGTPGEDSASVSFTIAAGTSPTATLSTSSATVGSTVDISGSGFSTSDTSCYVSSTAASTSTCSISDGTFSASFVVANVASSDYSVTVTGVPYYDSASATLSVGVSGPQITLSPTSSPAGSTVDVSGSGFNTADYSCSLVGTPVASETCSISDGALTGSFTVANVAVSSYTITATPGPEDDSASATFTLGTSSGTASITFNPASAKVSTTVSVTGSGFSSSDTSCTLSGTVVSTQSCTISDGTLTASFVVVSLSPGSYLVTATGSPESDYTSAYFTILSSSPAITLNSTSVAVGAAVQVTGTGFSSSDTSCSLSGTPVSGSSCSISNGALTGYFTVSNVSPTSYTITATGSPTGDSGSSTLAIVTSTATTTSAMPDFSVSATPSVAVNQGQYVTVPITLSSVNGLASSITMTTTWVGAAPSGVNLSISSPIALASGGTATSSLVVNATSNATPGSFTVQVGGASGSLSHTTSIMIVIQGVAVVTITTSTTANTMNSTSSSTNQTSTTTPVIPLNCPVSSAISGSELALPAQTLRGFRDQSILRTRTGADFMILFNSWYYSFSPAIASHIQTHQTQRALFRDALYPLIGILYASYYFYALLSPLNSEVAAATAGVVAAGLIGLIYLAPACYLCSRLLRRKFKPSKLAPTQLATWLTLSVILVGLGYATGDILPLGIAATNLVLCSLTCGSVLGTSALTRLETFSPRLLAAMPILCATRETLSSAWYSLSRTMLSLQTIKRRP